MSDPIRDNMSVANPADLAAMKQGVDTGQGQFGGMDANTSIRDFFGKLGIDVDGPVEQLKKFSQDTMKNGDPLGKMENIAGGIPPGGPDLPPGVPPQPPGAGAPGMDGLMQ